MNDKEVERQRYDDRALMVRKSTNSDLGSCGVKSISHGLRAPYSFYEYMLQRVLRPEFNVLEIGSGTGEFTESLLRSGAKVVATDISKNSLELLEMRYSDKNNLTTMICDMEALPFPDGMFDVVTSTGSLSYGDNQLVLSNIQRVVKPGGCFICLDSLNHNPVYRVNRYIHYLRSNRSRSTLKQMPTIDLISKYQNAFGGESTVRYFGGLSWLIMIFSCLGAESYWADISDRFDRLFRVRRSAFKFVLIVRKVV